jgi:hypothetical protein
MDALFTEPRDAKITFYPLRGLEKSGRLFQHPAKAYSAVASPEPKPLGTVSSPPAYPLASPRYGFDVKDALTVIPGAGPGY